MRFIDNEPDEGVAGQHITQADFICLANVPAGETVTIAVAYYLPTQAWLDAMIRAANRGVKIR